MKTPVTDTHWAANDRERFARFMEAMPATLETTFELWQRRVDHPTNAKFPKHSYLSVVEAIEYALNGDRSEPTGKTLSFLVLAENSLDTARKVWEMTEANGLGRNWMVRTISTQLVLG